MGRRNGIARVWDGGVLVARVHASSGKLVSSTTISQRETKIFEDESAPDFVIVYVWNCDCAELRKFTEIPAHWQHRRRTTSTHLYQKKNNTIKMDAALCAPSFIKRTKFLTKQNALYFHLENCFEW